MSREKRALEKEGVPNEKRQRLNLASVVVEAVKNDGLQKLCQSLEPLLRKVVGEEVERALAKFQLSNAELRTSPASTQEPDTERTNLQLQFKNRVALPLFTGSKVEGEQGSPLHVVLQDAKTGDLITTGPEASAKLEIVVLHGDFSMDDNDDWSQEEFASHEVRERDGKGPLLTGDLTVALIEGVGSLGELSFTDNSSWIRSRKFRLGVKVVEESYWGPRIREAKSEAFVVKDHRGELYKKHYPPELQDEVWRLDKIGKEGAFHRRLYKAGIKSVEDFLRLAVMDSQKLRNILGSGMSNKMWEGTIEHAKTCVLSRKLYVYYADEKQNVGIIFNTIFQLMGLISETRYLSADSLSDSEKIYVDKLVKVAYENWGRVVEYTGEAVVDLSLREHDIQEEESERQSDVTSCSQAAQVIRPTPSIPPSPAAAQWSPLLAATPGNEWLFYKELRTPTTNQVEDFTEDQIRAKSLEFLDNEEMNRQMQQLLYMITGSSVGETASVATKSITAVQGVRGRWLKIKAALRWGISIRNRAAARRARAQAAFKYVM